MNTKKTKQPFFIVGCPRSGTTLLQILLDSHPDIAIPPESQIFTRFSPIFKFYGDLGKPENVKRFVSDLVKDFAIRDWNMDISIKKYVAQSKGNAIKDIISLIFEEYTRKEKKTRWGDKTPQHAFFLTEIKRYFPEAKFIHLIRDGRDVAESLKRVFIGPRSIYRIAKRWVGYIKAFEDFKKEVNCKDYLEIFYEDLVREPNVVLKRLLSFLDEKVGIDIKSLPETNTRNFYIGHSVIHNSLKQSISKSKIGVFRERLSYKEIGIFETIAGEQLRKLNYGLTTNGTLKINVIDKIGFFLQDYVYRYARKLFSAGGIKFGMKQILFSFQYIFRYQKRHLFFVLFNRNNENTIKDTI